MKNVCNECMQPIRQAHKEHISRGKLMLLKKAADHVIATMDNDISLKVFNGDPNMYNNFQKLRYHGLIYYKEDGLIRKRGHWIITRNGWAFLRGTLDLPKYVTVQNNHILSRAAKHVGVKDVYYGCELIETTFEYFDDSGSPVGFRPLQKSAERQLSLV